MKLVKAAQLAKKIGIPRRTMSHWYKTKPELFQRIGRTYWIKLDRLTELPGISMVDAYTLGNSKWLKATDVARLSGISRRTIADWCKTVPGFAKRIGANWYVDLGALGASEDEVIEALQRLASGKMGIAASVRQ